MPNLEQKDRANAYPASLKLQENEHVNDDFTVQIPLSEPLSQDARDFLENYMKRKVLGGENNTDRFSVAEDGAIYLISQDGGNNAAISYYATPTKMHRDYTRLIKHIFEGSSQLPQLPEFTTLEEKEISEEHIKEYMVENRERLRIPLKAVHLPTLFKRSHKEALRTAKLAIVGERLEEKQRHELPQLAQLMQTLAPFADRMAGVLDRRGKAMKEKTRSAEQLLSPTQVDIPLEAFGSRLFGAGVNLKVNGLDTNLKYTNYGPGRRSVTITLAGQLHTYDINTLRQGVQLESPLFGTALRYMNGSLQLWAFDHRASIQLKQRQLDNFKKAAQNRPRRAA